MESLDGRRPDPTPRPPGTAESGDAKPRRWLAVVLTLLQGGIGHVYTGRPVRGLVVAASLGLLGLLAAVVAATGSAALVWLLAAFGLGAVGLAAVDAARIASRPRARFHTRGAVVLACGAFLLASIALGLGGDLARARWGARPFRSPSAGMFPTLLIGDHFYVDLGAFRRREPRRGDIVVFGVAKQGPQTLPADLRPDLPRETFVKRIVGLPGDQIAIRGGTITLNGELLERRSLGVTFEDELGRPLDVHEERVGSRRWRILEDPALDLPDPAPLTVPAGRYYVLGDNRDHSKDSRFWGTVAGADLVGPATAIYWSWDFNGTWSELLDPLAAWNLLWSRTRWARIGTAIE